MLIAFFNLLWIFYTFVIKRQLKVGIYKAYFFYAFFILLWVIANTYFQSGFLLISSEKFAKFMALMANLTSGFGIIGFYYLTALIRYQNKKIPLASYGFLLLLISVAVIFNLIPGATVKDVIIFEDGNFELIFGPLNNVFFIVGLLAIFAGFINFFFALKNEKISIRNAKNFYLLFGASLMYGSVVLFHIIFPSILHNYNYVWLPPLLSILDVLFSAYILLNRRFIDIRLFISNIFRAGFCFFVAYGGGYLLWWGFQKINIEPLFFYEKHIVTSIFLLLVYIYLFNFLKSHTFHKYFGLNNTEFLQKVVTDIKQKKKVYTSAKELEYDLKAIFKQSKNSNQCKLLLLNKKIQNQYPQLIQYLKSHNEILVTEEIRFVESEKETLFSFLEELEALGGVCLPLTHPSTGLVGLFALGGGKTKHLYSKNEINALNDLKNYLSVLLSEILYSTALKKEVQNKTIELHNKIQEKNELVEQQSDFIAVTAHEFRTPLSIALFQLDDMMDHMQSEVSLNKERLNKELNVIKSSLHHLKDLNKKLFDVQQYDLKKIKIKKTKVDLKSFIHDIYSDFSGLMQEKKMHFKFNDKLLQGFYFLIDAPQLRQVLHNLLNNAYKFTPEKGRITLHVEGNEKKILIKVIDNGKGIPKSMKTAIFNKFRTNSKGAGIGLGLYICQKIVELHHGRLWVEDSSKKGSTFCVQLENRP